jgi:hypothetical protein
MKDGFRISALKSIGTSVIRKAIEVQDCQALLLANRISVPVLNPYDDHVHDVEETSKRYCWLPNCPW